MAIPQTKPGDLLLKAASFTTAMELVDALHALLASCPHKRPCSIEGADFPNVGGVARLYEVKNPRGPGVAYEIRLGT